MLIKEGICTVAAISEAISIFPEAHGLGRRTSFNQRMTRLCEMRVLTETQRAELEWLWQVRSDEHIYDLVHYEYVAYGKRDWLRSVLAYHGLRDGLQIWVAAGKPKAGLP